MPWSWNLKLNKISQQFELDLQTWDRSRWNFWAKWTMANRRLKFCCAFVLHDCWKCWFLIKSSYSKIISIINDKISSSTYNAIILTIIARKITIAAKVQAKIKPLKFKVIEIFWGTNESAFGLFGIVFMKIF